MGGCLGRTLVLLAALAAPAPSAGAPPRIAVAPVRGDESGALTRQLRSLLCAELECVRYSKVRTRGRLDFAKVEALDVAAIVVGTSAASRRTGRVLELALLRRSLHPSWKGSYPLGRGGTLRRGAAADLSADVAAELGSGRPSPAPPPVAAAPPAATEAPAPAVLPPPAPPPAEARPEPAVSVAEQPALERPAKPAAEGIPAAGRQPEAEPLAAAEAGVSLGRRTLSYQGVPAGNLALRGLEASLIASPRLRLELYPLSPLTEGVFSGLGLEADYGFSVGLTTKDPAGGADHPTSFSRLGLGLLWRIRPLASSRFALIPAVSYQRLKFTVGGTPIQGLPDADLSGVKAAVDAEIPVGGGIAILLGAGYVRWTTAADLLGDAFFPGGSAHAIEADAGVLVGLGGAFALRVLGSYSGTQYSLESTPGATYQATGATDRYLGGSATLRAQF